MNFQFFKRFPLWLLMLVVFCVDQSSKLLARQFFSVSINTGISGGRLSDLPSIVYGIGLVIVIFLIKKVLTSQWSSQRIWWALLAGAGISNFVDRILWGGVVDFLPVPVFNYYNNLADWLILVAVLGMVFSWKNKSDMSTSFSA